MGLAGQKNRTKLSRDPNNTAWANSTDTYGHKILRSQGWQPGDYLGARDASHADHYTTANASHIRVLLREDNLGIGAQKGKPNAQTFGLSLFSGLLGRLNGKSDEDVQRQESAMRDVELRTFTSQKYGFMNFVRGGLLVGDKIEDIVDKVSRETDVQAQGKKRKVADVEDLEGSDNAGNGRKHKAHKANHTGRDNDEVPTQGQEEASAPRRPSKEKKRRRNRSDDLQQEAEPVLISDSISEKKSGKEKRRKSKREDVGPEANDSESKTQRRRLREEKRARKEERRRQKEKKRRLKPGNDETPSTTVTTTTSAITSANTSGTSTPQLSSMAFGGSRHAVRQRYIQQKRLASMNAQSLNEIFMLKSAA